MDSYVFILYWVIYLLILLLFTIVVYDWKKTEKKNAVYLYIIAILSCTYLIFGPLYCIFAVQPDLKLAEEYKAYQQQVITPIYEQYNNTKLPDGYYYIGCEINNVEAEIIDGVCIYTYTFEVIDCEGRNDFYQWQSENVLNLDTQYLLVMDSLATNITTDDQISVIWECVN